MLYSGHSIMQRWLLNRRGRECNQATNDKVEEASFKTSWKGGSVRTYIETFDDGPGGWLGWTSNAKGPHRLEIADSCAIERSPWWIDYNQAPPGGGYLHLPFCIYTSGQWCDPKRYERLSGSNRFIDGRYPLDFTNASVTVRLRGPLDPRGAELLFHIQSRRGPVFVNHCIAGRPLQA